MPLSIAMISIPPHLVQLGSGRIGMWSFSTMELAFPVGTLPYPVSHVPFLLNAESGYVISSGTQYSQQAWRWLSFVSQSETISEQFSITSAPARKSVAERSNYWEQMDAEQNASVRTTLSRSTALMPVEHNAPLLRQDQTLRTALSSVISGEQQALEALGEAQSAFEQWQLATQQTPTTPLDTEPIVVAPVVPASPPVATTTITFIAEANGFELRGRASEFSQRYPHIVVDVKAATTLGETLALEYLATHADCFSR
jgi:hypothetical protein